MTTLSHDWRRMDMTKVDVIGLTDEGEPAIFNDSDTETKVFCWVCHAGLTDMSMELECLGHPIDDDEE